MASAKQRVVKNRFYCPAKGLSEWFLGFDAGIGAELMRVNLDLCSVY
jgi:hypothetical protein